MTVGELKRALEHVPDDCPFLIMGVEVQNVFQFSNGVVSTEGDRGDGIVKVAVLFEGGRLLYSVYAPDRPEHFEKKNYGDKLPPHLDEETDDIDELLRDDGWDACDCWPLQGMSCEEINNLAVPPLIYMLEQQRLHPLAYDAEKDPARQCQLQTLVDKITKHPTDPLYDDSYTVV